MSLGLLFPGQGTQHAHMLPWLDSEAAAQPLLRRLAAQVGADWRERLQQPMWATTNRVAQPLLTALGLAAWSVLCEHLPPPSAVAGYSIGEVAAFAVAGVFDATTALQIAERRAALMDEAAPAGTTGLLALHGIDAPRLARCCAEHGLVPAIVLDADDVLVGGPVERLADARRALEAEGMRCTPIAAQVASHTPWMRPAVAPLRALLDTLPFAAPRCALVADATGQTEFRPDLLRTVLAEQIAVTMPWDRCMDTLAERGVTCVLEVGPGTTLSRRWNRRHPQVPARSLEDFQGPDGVCRWVERILVCPKLSSFAAPKGRFSPFGRPGGTED